MITSRLNIRCCSSFKPGNHCVKQVQSVLKRINQYNDNILILRNLIKNSILTENIYESVYYDQLEEMYVAIADFKFKIKTDLNNIQNKQSPYYLE